MHQLIDLMGTLPPRHGPFPRMTPANPQEQLDQFPPDWRLIERLAEHAFSLPMVIERPTQVAPDGSRALTLDDSVPMELQAAMVGREFAHIHNPPVGSMHLMLPREARELALSKRWVLRHPFSVRGWGPEGTVFVFAPRDEHELGWAQALLSVSHAWAIGAVQMKSMKVRVGRAAVTFAVILTAVVSTIVDVLPGEDGHMGNSQWPPHALFHDAAMFCTLLAMMGIFLWLLLRKSREPQVGMLAAMLFPFGFWSGFFYITTLFPQASLLTATVRDASGRFVPLNAGNIAQWPEHVKAATPVVLGVPIYVNVAIGIVLMAMAAFGLWCYRRGLRDGELDPKLIP